MPKPGSQSPKYESFKTYDEEYESNVDLQDYADKFTHQNINSRDFDVKGFTRDDFNKRLKENNIPKTNDRYERRYVVFDKKYINDLEYDNDDVVLSNRIADIADFDKDELKIFDPKEVSNAITNSMLNDHDFREADDIAYDINTAKQKTVNFFLGNGNPNEAYQMFLDQKLKKENIIAYDQKKVEKFISSINSNLDQSMKSVTNPNSEFNKRRTFYKNDVNSYDKIVQELRDGDETKKNLSETELFQDSMNDKNVEPEKSISILDNYLTLKAKVDNYPNDVREQNRKQYDKETKALPQIKTYLETVCKFDVDKINRNNFAEESNKYYRRAKENNPFVHDLYNLGNSIKEYNSHNFLWKWFMGGKLRDKINKSADELVKNGMNKDVVDLLKAGKASDSKVDDIQNELTDSLTDAYLGDNERHAILHSLDALSTVASPNKQSNLSQTKVRFGDIYSEEALDKNGEEKNEEGLDDDVIIKDYSIRKEGKYIVEEYTIIEKNPNNIEDELVDIDKIKSVEDEPNKTEEKLDDNNEKAKEDKPLTQEDLDNPNSEFNLNFYDSLQNDSNINPEYEFTETPPEDAPEHVVDLENIPQVS